MLRRIKFWLVGFSDYDIEKFPPGILGTQRILINNAKNDLKTNFSILCTTQTCRIKDFHKTRWTTNISEIRKHEFQSYDGKWQLRPLPHIIQNDEFPT